ncbi:dnaJ homolog subfamily C member 4 isoform X1 [Phascolarctos cinereus]
MPILRLVPQLCQLCPRCPPSARLLSSTVCLRARQSNYYELLGIRPDASMKEVKRAFFAKSKELHPDRDPKNPALHNQFVELNEAYRVLSKESSRQEYDSRLSLRGSMPPPRHTSQSPYQSYRPALPLPLPPAPGPQPMPDTGPSSTGCVQRTTEELGRGRTITLWDTASY